MRPHLTYTAPVWYVLILTTLRKKLQVLQNLALWFVTQTPRYVTIAAPRAYQCADASEHLSILADNPRLPKGLAWLCRPLGYHIAPSHGTHTSSPHCIC